MENFPFISYVLPTVIKWSIQQPLVVIIMVTCQVFLSMLHLFLTYYLWLCRFIVDLTYNSAKYAGIKCGTTGIAIGITLTVCNG